MIQIEDFDFDHSVEMAWRRFSLRLASVLSMMDETEPLLLTPYDSTDKQWYLRFFQQTSNSITAEISTTSGVGLPDWALVWLPENHWNHTGDSFLLTWRQDDCEAMAEASVAVLRQVFMVQHPVFLDSNILTEILREPDVVRALCDQPNDIYDTMAYPHLDEVQLAAMVFNELLQFFGSEPMRDQDGDYAVRVGSTMIFIHIPSDGKEVRLFSMLVHDIAGRSRAAEVLNDVNAHTRWVRFHLVRDKIIATMSVLANPFVPAHFRQAITEITNIADGVDDLLAASLHGKTTFPVET